MGFSEEELRRTAELRVWLENEIKRLEEQLNRYKELLTVVDTVLRRASFTPASLLSQEPTSPKEKGPILSTSPPTGSESASTGQGTTLGEYQEARPLRRSRDGFLLANAFISPTTVCIVPSSEVNLNIDTPPFRSFFINRILEGMKAKDTEYLGQGKIRSDEILDYGIEEEGGIIKRIIVKNYRDKSRLNEILNTATWAITRMLEKG